MKKLLSLFLSAVLITASLASCADNAPKEKVFNYVIDETRFNIIEADGTSKYTIVRPENATDQILSAVMLLKNAILEHTGVELEVKSDFEKKGRPEFQRQDHEILVGLTNREESLIADSLIERSKDFSIVQSGTRIAVLSKHSSYIEEAVNYFIDNYLNKENCSLSTPVGEQVVKEYDYAIEKFEVNGVDIKDYDIVYSDISKDKAYQLQAFVFENYGYILPVEKKSKNQNKFILACDNIEPFASLKDELNPLEVRQIVDENGISVMSGILVDGSIAVNSFIEKYFSEESVKPEIMLTIDSSSETLENDVIKIDDKEILDSIEKKAEERKVYIKNTPNRFTELPEGSKGRIFYVSNDGSDSNDGLSPETAWATIEKVNNVVAGIRKGDIVLFRRGDMFRGKIKAVEGVTYSSYGKGEKPVINGSRINFADPNLWVKTDYENVYKLVLGAENVGNIVFNYSGNIDQYDELIGELVIVGDNTSENLAELKKDLQFSCGLESKNLYLYSEHGNPGERFDSIEICESGNLFSGSAKDVIVDNLTFIFGGSHGVGMGTVTNRTVQNCIFAWIGGSILKGFNGGNTTRYGNAVEVYGGCNGYYVYDNWIYQIYDTGITHQYSAADNIIKMENIEYRGNLIELCHWSIEYYNRGITPGSCLKNIYVHDNIALNGCYGWGSVGREGGGALHNSFTIVDDVENYYVEDNIFAYSKGNIVRYNNGGDRKIQFKNNTYVQYYGRALGYMFNKTERFDATAVTNLVDVMKEENPTIVFLMHDAEKEAEQAKKLAEQQAAKEQTEAPTESEQE